MYCTITLKNHINYLRGRKSFKKQKVIFFFSLSIKLITFFVNWENINLCQQMCHVKNVIFIVYGVFEIALHCVSLW